MVGWVLPFLAGVHCFADIDQAGLLGGGGVLLGELAEKIIFCICIFSDFHSFSGYFLIALGPFSLIFYFCDWLLSRIVRKNWIFRSLVLYDVRRTSGGRLGLIVRSLIQ